MHIIDINGAFCLSVYFKPPDLERGYIVPVGSQSQGYPCKNFY